MSGWTGLLFFARELLNHSSQAQTLYLEPHPRSTVWNAAQSCFWHRFMASWGIPQGRAALGQVSSQGASHSSGDGGPCSAPLHKPQPGFLLGSFEMLCMTRLPKCILQKVLLITLFSAILPCLNTADMDRARFKPNVSWRNGSADSQRLWIPDISCEDQLQVCYSMPGTTEHALHRAPLSFSIYCKKHN